MEITPSQGGVRSAPGAGCRIGEAAARIEDVDTIVLNDPDVMKASEELKKNRSAHDAVDIMQKMMQCPRNERKARFPEAYRVAAEICRPEVEASKTGLRLAQVGAAVAGAGLVGLAVAMGMGGGVICLHAMTALATPLIFVPRLYDACFKPRKMEKAMGKTIDEARRQIDGILQTSEKKLEETKASVREKVMRGEYAAKAAPARRSIEEEPDFVVIGGIKVDKRKFGLILPGSLPK